MALMVTGVSWGQRQMQHLTHSICHIKGVCGLLVSCLHRHEQEPRWDNLDRAAVSSHSVWGRRPTHLSWKLPGEGRSWVWVSGKSRGAGPPEPSTEDPARDWGSTFSPHNQGQIGKTLTSSWLHLNCLNFIRCWDPLPASLKELDC